MRNMDPALPAATARWGIEPGWSGRTMKQLFMGAAGTWIANSTNSNLIPVVANGKVFVSSYKQLTILGLRTQGSTAGQP